MQHDDDRLAKRLWRHRGQARPAFAIKPLEDQESVWDYPRPPILIPDSRLIVVRAGQLEIASTRRSVRILETASPPTFYLPREDVHTEFLRPANGGSFCEWKGQASYFDAISADEVLEKAAWSYQRPFLAFSAIAGYISFYPGRIECYVDGERVRPQAGGFYGGWITDEIVGPFKGEAGTGGW
jgi:uncharacterized protein (DUF427 family)